MADVQGYGGMTCIDASLRVITSHPVQQWRLGYHDTSFVPCGNSLVPWELMTILPKKFLTCNVPDVYSEASLV